jgi:O-antigen/teichoic acid export membrane protein
LENRASNGALWALIGIAGGMLLRFAGNLVLTRLMVPSAFGIMVIVNTFLLGIILFSDVGIGTSVIQNKRGHERDFMNTAWTLSILRSVLLAAIACACAWPMARFYQEPQLLWLIPASSLGLLTQGASSMRMTVANRDMNLRLITLVEFGSQVVGVAVMLLWAWRAPSVWALVVGSLATSTLRTVFSFVFFPRPHERFTWDKAIAKEIMQFGVWIFLSSSFMFIANNLDRFIFGKITSLEVLGIYNQALQLSMIPAGILGRLSSAVMMPLLSKVVNADGDVNALFVRSRWKLLVFGGFINVCFIVGNDALIQFLYPEVYAPAAPMLRALAAAAWFGVVLQGPNDAALLAKGAFHFTALGSLAKLVLLVVGIGGFGLWAKGQGKSDVDVLMWSLVGVTFSEIGRYAVSTWAIRKMGLSTWRQDVLMTVFVIASSLVSIGVVSVAAPLSSSFAAALSAPMASSGVGMFEKMAPKMASLCAGVVAAAAVTSLWGGLWLSLKRRRVV